MHRLKRLLRGLRNRSQRAVYTRLLRRLVRPGAHRLERLGSEAAGWVVPIDLIAPDWTCYCGGVGEDVTFDLELIDRRGCHVFAFDPTPRAVRHVERAAASNPRFHFFPVGLWSSDTELKFYASRNPALVNHSVVNLQGTQEYFVAPCRRLSSLMSELGHDRIDLLKIDIEGAEYEVLESLAADRLTPVRVLCVEFDQPAPVQRIYAQARRVIGWGYDLVCIDGWNCTFVRR